MPIERVGIAPLPFPRAGEGGIVKGYLGKQQLSRATISSNSFDPHSVGWILFSRVERKHSDHDYSLLIYPRKYIIVEFSILFVQVIFASILFFPSFFSSARKIESRKQSVVNGDPAQGGCTALNGKEFSSRAVGSRSNGGGRRLWVSRRGCVGGAKSFRKD